MALIEAHFLLQVGAAVCTLTVNSPLEDCHEYVCNTVGHQKGRKQEQVME